MTEADYMAYAKDEMHRLVGDVYAPLEDVELVESGNGRKLYVNGKEAVDLMRMIGYLDILPFDESELTLGGNMDADELLSKLRNFA